MKEGLKLDWDNLQQNIEVKNFSKKKTPVGGASLVQISANRGSISSLVVKTNSKSFGSYGEMDPYYETAFLWSDYSSSI